MAVDTASKRFSLIGFAQPHYPMVLIPDGTVAAGDRADMLALYSGITLSNPLTDLPADALLLLVEEGRILSLTETYRELVPIETERILKLVD